MLILARRTNQTVVITVGAIRFEVRVCEIDGPGDKVRLGFSAPRDVVIDRGEIDQRKRRDAGGRRDDDR